MIQQKQAQQFIDKNLSVIPCDLKKKPALPSWKKYQKAKMSETEVVQYFGKSEMIGIVCGSISDNLEVIDIDDASVFPQFYDAILNYFDGNGHMILTVKTKKGYHIYFRNDFDMANPPDDIICRNLKLAQKKKTNNAIPIRIETRGQGGYVIAPPSPNYSVMYGASLNNIPKWSRFDRKAIFDIAKDFNEYQAPSVKKSEPAYIPRTDKDYRLTSWTDYNSKDDWMNELDTAGFSFVYEDNQRSYWLRSGETDAKYSGNFHKEKRLFKVFSSSTVFEPEQPYSPSALRCLVRYGDTSKDSMANNAKDLYNDGYGEQWDAGASSLIERIKTKYAELPTASHDTIMDLMAIDLSAYSTDSTDQRQIINAGKDAFKKEKTKADNKQYDTIEQHIESIGLVTNLMTNRVETKELIQLKERDYVSIYLDIVKDNPKISKQLVYDYIESDRLPSYHPFEKYFDSLTAIEPVGEQSTIYKLFDSLNVEFDNDDEKKLCFGLFTKWMLQFLTSGYQVSAAELMLVLTGKMNNGKTYFFKNLLPKSLDKYFITIKDFPRKDEDAKAMMCENILVLRDDITGTGSKDKDWIKSVLSSETLTFRAPYQRSTDTHRRYAVLCATTNDNNVLGSDERDNRRVFPLKVDDRDQEAFDAIQEIGIDNLWAELKYLFDNAKDKTMLTSTTHEEMEYLSTRDELKEVDLVKEFLIENFESSDEAYTTTYEIKELLSLHKYDTTGQLLSVKLKEIGFVKGKRQRFHNVIGSNNPVSCWKVKRVDPNLVNYNIVSDKNDNVDIGNIEEDMPF